MMKTESKITSAQSFLTMRKELSGNGKVLVFTNGCFDVLHLGHVDYLEKARSKGDFLVVAVNTDASVSRLKGPSRPVNPLYARQRVLAALHFVDAVIAFDEDTPASLITVIKPDVLVKGSDYEVSAIVGANTVLSSGGRVETIDLVDGFSTTRILEKGKS